MTWAREQDCIHRLIFFVSLFCLFFGGRHLHRGGWRRSQRRDFRVVNLQQGQVRRKGCGTGFIFVAHCNAATFRLTKKPRSLNIATYLTFKCLLLLRIGSMGIQSLRARGFGRISAAGQTGKKKYLRCMLSVTVIIYLPLTSHFVPIAASERKRRW